MWSRWLLHADAGLGWHDWPYIAGLAAFLALAWWVLQRYVRHWGK